MKRFRFVIFAVAVAALALASCKKEKGEEPYGPANTMTVDGTARQITTADGNHYDVNDDSKEALSLRFTVGSIKYHFIASIAQDQYGSNLSLPGTGQFWDIGFSSFDDSTSSHVLYYECYWNDSPPTITGGHIYIKRTGDGVGYDLGVYILRFDITFRDGRRIYGNYSGNFEAPK